jgi:hypothetical protein
MGGAYRRGTKTSSVSPQNQTLSLVRVRPLGGEDLIVLTPVLPENLNLLKGLTFTPRAIILDHVCFGPCYSSVMRSR